MPKRPLRQVGLKLQGIPAASALPVHLENRVVAIDAPNLLYAFYAVQLLHREATPERRDAALRSATRGLLARVQDLAQIGARSVVVFDGPPHPLKRAHLEARDAARSVPAIGHADYAPIADAVRDAGIPFVHAPHDAEGQASAMARAGRVHVVATTDWDALAMGAPRLLRNLSASPRKTEGRRWMLVDADAALAHLATTRERLAAAAVLMGCDYHPGYPRVGPKKAFALLPAHLDAEAALDAALAHLHATEDDAERARAAYRLLAHPPHDPHAALRIPVRNVATTLDRFA